MNTLRTAGPGNGQSRLVVFGIGNCGRNDDGLGWSFIERIEREWSVSAQVEYRYQLQVEDAALIRDADLVVFVDSYRGNLPEGYSWQPCKASSEFEFTTHALTPQAVLYLCEDLYGKRPDAHLLLIQGEAWELKTGLSPSASNNLEHAVRFFYGNTTTNLHHRRSVASLCSMQITGESS